MTKIQKILSGLLALQLLAAVIVFWPRNAAGAADVVFFEGVAAADIARLTIADDTGAQVELARQGDGWVLASGGDYPVKADVLAPVLDKIVALQSNRLVARTAASQRQLQVSPDDFLRQITLTFQDGRSQTFYLGSATNLRATNFRLDGQDDTYLVADLNIFELSANASSWIDTVYVSGVPEDSVTALTLTNANGALSFRRDASQEGESAWTLDGLAEGELLNAPAFNSLLTRILNLRLVRPLGVTAEANYGLDQPQATITVVANVEESTQTYTLAIGARLPDQDDDPSNDNYIVKWSESPYYVAVAPFSVETLTEHSRTDFVQLPTPEPTPTTEPTPTP